MMKTIQLKNKALVIFGKDFPAGRIARRKFDTIVADKIFQEKVEGLGCQFIELETLVEPGSVYEAGIFLEELSYLNLPNGSRLSKSFIYKGYELWWIHYNDLFNYFCLPYTQHRRLLEYLRSFKSTSFHQPPYKALFSCYLRAYRRESHILREVRLKVPTLIPFGVLLQIFITLLFIPILMVRKCSIMLFTGDKFEEFKDYDFRKKFIYEELRQRELPFVEFIRSLESWKTVLKHAIKRKRPVIYSEGVLFVGKFLSTISGGRHRVKSRFGLNKFELQKDPAERFKFLVSTQYILGVYDDIWTIRIMKLILHVIGVKVAMIPAATERNFHSVLGCKLNSIPIVGILYAVLFRYSAPWDFMPGFDGKKMLSVDTYGVWSEWWREYYIKNSKAYKPEQLHVSGPVRPLEARKEPKIIASPQKGYPRVLFISEQLAVPSEVMQYLRKLIEQRDIKLTIKFRPYHDGFEEWLLEHEPSILKLGHIKIAKGGMQEAIQDIDVVVGCKSTGVLEALLQLKVPIFFRTQKWGDYYNLTKSDEGRRFFAENPAELIRKIKDMCSISRESIVELREQYFGDPHKNGSKWVIDKIEKLLEKSTQ